MPDSLIDLVGLQVGAEDFLVAALETTAQPIWVVDPDGVSCTLDRRELTRGVGRDPDRPRVTNRAGERPAGPPDGVRLKDARALRAGTGFGDERRGKFYPCRDAELGADAAEVCRDCLVGEFCRL